MGLQRLIEQVTTDAELVAAALTMKEAVFRKNMMEGPRFRDGFDSVPLYTDNTLALHVADDRMR